MILDTIIVGAIAVVCAVLFLLIVLIIIEFKRDKSKTKGGKTK